MRICLVLLWLGAVAYGSTLLMNFESRPGEVGQVPAQWPGSKLISRTAGVKTLAMFLHPKCSCSKASIEELGDVLAKSTPPLKASVIFFAPEQGDSTWEGGANWALAASDLHMQPLIDRGGKEATRFGALTSGHTVLYDEQGKLIFSGGITRARGVVGNSERKVALTKRLSFGETETFAEHVFGCKILGK